MNKELFLLVHRGSVSLPTLYPLSTKSMAYHKVLANRVREMIGRQAGITEKGMFGGLCFFLNGNILVGIWKDSLIVRVGPDRYEEMLLEDYVSEFDPAGKPMRGWVLVDFVALEEDEPLQTWIDRAFDYVSFLEPK